MAVHMDSFPNRIMPGKEPSSQREEQRGKEKTDNRKAKKISWGDR